MSLGNRIMLITYPDSLGRNLRELRYILHEHLCGVVGGLHILPFYPSSADRGFAPIDYRMVDARFGTYEDILELGAEYDLMVDFMINHLSRQSPQFEDFLARKDGSLYRDMFIRYRDFWPNGEPTPEDLNRIYRRRPRPPYVEVTFADGSTEKIWCTFSHEQIDLNVNAPVTWDFI